MSTIAELPPETNILVVQVFNDEDCSILAKNDVTDEQISAIFQRLATQDPGFEQFAATVRSIASACGLLVHESTTDDEIILSGEINSLKQASASLDSADYTNFLDTADSFQDHIRNNTEGAADPVTKAFLN